MHTHYRNGRYLRSREMPRWTRSFAEKEFLSRLSRSKPVCPSLFAKRKDAGYLFFYEDFARNCVALVSDTQHDRALACWFLLRANGN